ncbi:hypothetical protein B0H14DRAFT_3438478 [Mycena olivaceomarginata]|nr:hypothetical protein B0H14DRAFT_3438478 [Mycena olivaceomarginata]
MHTTLDNAFEQLNSRTCPSIPGGVLNTPAALRLGSFMWLRGGMSPGYTHTGAEDASIQVNKFKGSAHKKHLGWSSATSAFDNARRPGAYDTSRRPPPSTPPPSTPPGTLFVKSKKPVVATPTKPRPLGDALPACTSAPSTPTASRKNLLYVYSRGNDTTIYASQHQVSTAARQGLADGSFRKVDVTSGVRSTFELAEDSALECYNISDFSDEE